MGKKPGKNAAAGHARYLGRLLQDAEFVQASQNAEMEEAGAITAAGKREALSDKLPHRHVAWLAAVGRWMHQALFLPRFGRAACLSSSSDASRHSTKK
jgi:hypothetical protein